MIDEFEIFTSTGKFKNGAELTVYLTNINIDTTFGFFDIGEGYFSFTKMFGMNYGTSNNQQIYLMFQSAFEDLIDYATLISKSGSARRITFFSEQHNLVDQISI